MRGGPAVVVDDDDDDVDPVVLELPHAATANTAAPSRPVNALRFISSQSP
jgi:hypothetical protein